MANVHLQLAVKSSSNIGLRVVTERGLVPLVRLSNVRRKNVLGGRIFRLADEEGEDSFVVRNRLLQQHLNFDEFFEFSQLNAKSQA